jgi:chromosome segregation ATPase
MDTYYWTRDEYDQHMELVVGYAAGIDRADKNHAIQAADIAKVKGDLATATGTLTNRINTVDAFTKDLQKFDSEVWARLQADTTAINALKSTDTTLTNKIGAVELRVNNTDSAVNALKATDTALTQRIATLERSTVPARVEALEGVTKNHYDLIVALQQALTTQATTIATLHERITKLEEASHSHPVEPDPPAEPPAELTT